ncbi:hypothetical protein M0R45_015794 [Rubus argutus]|uniref:Uncharacterized protein n=1 Tax=Rubus argutus TaxID=59490 RepID=A0AAW1XSM7_RUBAR
MPHPPRSLPSSKQRWHWQLQSQPPSATPLPQAAPTPCPTVGIFLTTVVSHGTQASNLKPSPDREEDEEKKKQKLETRRRKAAGVVFSHLEFGPPFNSAVAAVDASCPAIKSARVAPAQSNVVPPLALLCQVAICHHQQRWQQLCSP